MEKYMAKDATTKESNEGPREEQMSSKAPAPSTSPTRAAPASMPSTPKPPPTTIKEATKALEKVTYFAGRFAERGAYLVVAQGHMADFTYAKAGASIATAAATAAFSITDAQARYGTLVFDPFIHSADHAVLAAEATYAALAASSGTTMWFKWALWSLLMVLPRLLLWLLSPLKLKQKVLLRPPDVSLFFSTGILKCSITSAATSAAAAQSAIEAAAATDKVTTLTATGCHVPYDANDLSRLYAASRLASASASVAHTAASTLRTRHPILSVRTARAACTAMAASRDATVMRMQIILAILHMDGPGSDHWGKSQTTQMQDWITDFDLLKASQPGRVHFGARSASLDEIFGSKDVKDGLLSGRITVDTGSGCASDPDMSDDSSSITII